MTSTSKAAWEYIEMIAFGQADLAKPEKGESLSLAETPRAQSEKSIGVRKQNTNSSFSLRALRLCVRLAFF
jgi:hypothetical protein